MQLSDNAQSNMYTPNCNNVVTEKKQKAKRQIGIN